MKNIFIALSICFCFSQAIGQSKDNKTTTEKKNVISINELLQGKWQSPKSEIILRLHPKIKKIN